MDWLPSREYELYGSSICAACLGQSTNARGKGWGWLVNKEITMKIMYYFTFFFFLQKGSTQP